MHIFLIIMETISNKGVSDYEVLLQEYMYNKNLNNTPDFRRNQDTEINDFQHLQW